MIASALELHNPTERDKFEFFSFSGTRLLNLARYFRETITNATNREGKKLLARARKVYGNKLIQETIALLDWLEGLSEQYLYNLGRFLTLNPYHAERFLSALPKLGENFPEFVATLDDARGEDALVTPKQIRDALGQFLPSRGPRPKFDPGIELTEEHFAYFRKKVLGRSKKAEIIAEKEELFTRYLSVAGEIAKGQPLKVEQMAEAIARCGDDPNTLLPRPSREFPFWNPSGFLVVPDTPPILGEPRTDGDGNRVPENAPVSIAEEFEESVESGKTVESEESGETVESEESETVPLAISDDTEKSETLSLAIAPDTVESETLSLAIAPKTVESETLSFSISDDTEESETVSLAIAPDTVESQEIVESGENEKNETLSLAIAPERGENETLSLAIAPERGESSNRDTPLEPMGERTATGDDRPFLEFPAFPSPPPVGSETLTGDTERVPIETRTPPRLAPGVKVKTTGSGEVGRISRKMKTGWLVIFKGGLTRILQDERLIALPDGKPVENAGGESKSKPKNSKKKGFGLLIA